ncbi:MAG TPA: citramalate synthase [Gammaproteobacteria bacterium]|nr:citramalate synthase [Gammaproteobacteria bacterium]
MSDNRVYLYDSTLRDGQQTQGVDFTSGDKIAISCQLDLLGVDYVEGGWPGANPADDQFFGQLPDLQTARFAAFGMTRRPGRSAEEDAGLAALLACDTPVICLVGKSWDFHVRVALRTTEQENLAMIGDSIRYCVDQGREAVYDAEHFFDGYKANPEFALSCLHTALDAGARWAVLCDTNGGTLPDEVAAISAEVCEKLPGSRLGIHCHNDTGNAVANSLAAVNAGVRQVQGTLNGLGERCGNANLVTLLPLLMLRLGFETGVDEAGLKNLVSTSHLVDERLNRNSDRHAPFVGANAFAHKGGLHVSAVQKDPRSYEHIDPELVGNRRKILVSDQAGRANVLVRLAELGIEVEASDRRVDELVAQIKQREHLGFAYDGASASFEMLARRALGQWQDHFTLQSFRVTDERRTSADGTVENLSEATMKVQVDGVLHMTVAEGNGPVNALDNALRKALLPAYPQLLDMQLVDYKVRILESSSGTAAVTRVMVESADAAGRRWSTVGASGNVIEASYQALFDAVNYKLFIALRE